MTLIELMVALVIMMIVALALMQSSLIAMNANIVNALRDEAVSVAEQRMNELRSTPSLTATTGLVADDPPTITRNVRSKANFPFTIKRQVSDINTNSKQVVLNVNWTYNKGTYTHSVSTVVRNQ